MQNKKEIYISSLIRDTKNFRTEEFLIDLAEERDCFNTDILFTNQSTVKQFDNFIKISERTLNKHAPLQKKSKKEIK